MSGHSHYATIKRKKETTDAAKGKVFSKMSRGISMAIKTGGGPNPDTNYKLRMAIDTAKAANMPKANIDRALAKASESVDLEEIRYEGFGPEGVSVIVDVATDNRNRAGQEIKGLFERGGGRLAGPGAVSYNFEPKGVIIVSKQKDAENQMLEMIDLGIEDIDDNDEGIEVYTNQENLSKTVNTLKDKGFDIKTSELTMRPKTYQHVNNQATAKKVLNLLDMLEENDDVQKVYANFDIPTELLNNI